MVRLLHLVCSEIYTISIDISGNVWFFGDNKSTTDEKRETIFPPKQIETLQNIQSLLW